MGRIAYYHKEGVGKWWRDAEKNTIGVRKAVQSGQLDV